MLILFDHGICIDGDILLYSAVTVEIFYIYICMYVWILDFCVRRSVYFLNICYIRVFYNFNRNRVLEVGIRVVVSPCPD
jgi:hypothetical protein